MPALGYLLTFNTYGTWLHGDERGSIDKHNNIYQYPRIAPNPQLQSYKKKVLKAAPYTLDSERQRLALSAIRKHADYRNWILWAAHVRTCHVHLVVTGDISPENMSNQFKSYISRDLNLANFDPPNRERWARHGSTKYLMTEQSLFQAIRYVVDEQGEPMAVYEKAQEPRPPGSGTSGTDAQSDS